MQHEGQPRENHDSATNILLKMEGSKVVLNCIKLILRWFAFSEELKNSLSEARPLPSPYWALVMCSKGTVSIKDAPTSNQIMVSRLLPPPSFL